MLKACCLPYACHKMLACLSCCTSSESWQCGWYLLCQVLSLLTIEEKEINLSGSLSSNYDRTVCCCQDQHPYEVLEGVCRHTKENILTSNRQFLLPGYGKCLGSTLQMEIWAPENMKSERIWSLWGQDRMSYLCSGNETQAILTSSQKRGIFI